MPVPCRRNDPLGYVFYVALIPQIGGEVFQANPTLAAGDVRIAVDDAAPANLATLPVVDADFTKRVRVQLSQAETNGDNLTVIFSDVAGAEWCDLIINIRTSLRQIDDLAQTGADGDTLETLSDQLDLVAVPGDQMGLVNGAITGAAYDNATAFPLAQVDAGVTEVARTGADGDTLETLSDQLDGIAASNAFDIP